jgi:hypothetical protein
MTQSFNWQKRIIIKICIQAINNISFPYMSSDFDGDDDSLDRGLFTCDTV